jgi:hypothetical protein
MVKKRMWCPLCLERHAVRVQCRHLRMARKDAAKAKKADRYRNPRGRP